MRKRMRNKRRRVDGFSFPTWAAGAIVAAAGGALIFLWLGARCEMIGTAIGEREARLERLRRDYSTQLTHWTQETTADRIKRALDTHGIDMSMGGHRIAMTHAELAAARPGSHLPASRPHPSVARLGRQPRDE